MHVFQTAGVPPNNGRIIFPTIGWTRNKRVALTNSVTPNSFGTDRLRDRRRTPEMIRGAAHGGEK
jgi:hypothetical protein